MFHPVPRTDRWDPVMVAAVIGLLVLAMIAVSLLAA
jgi:hypothetical protein